MKTIYIKMGLLLGLTTSVFAEFAPPPSYSNTSTRGGGNQQEKMSIYYPHDTSPDVVKMPNQLKKNHFEIGIDKDEVSYVQKRKQRFQKLLDGTYDANVIQKVSYRPFRAVDNINVMTNYITAIYFPENYKIKKAVSSVDQESIRTSQNVLFIKPKKDYQEGNIFVSLSDGRKNTIVSLVVKKFIANVTREDNIFYSVIEYVSIPKISDYELLKIYFKLCGKSKIKYFDKDGKTDVIEYKNIPFFITRDDRFGEIEYKGVNFRISNSQ